MTCMFVIYVYNIKALRCRYPQLSLKSFKLNGIIFSGHQILFSSRIYLVLYVILRVVSTLGNMYKYV